jgi:hypothetical protein
MPSAQNIPKRFWELPARRMPSGMQRTGKHKGIREKREDVKVIFEQFLSWQLTGN